MPDHTPGPIHIEHEFNLIASDGYSLTSASGTDAVRFHNRGVANAHRAALCWNSQDALVAALRLAQARYRRMWGEPAGMCAVGRELFAIDAALALVEKSHA